MALSVFYLAATSSTRHGIKFFLAGTESKKFFLNKTGIKKLFLTGIEESNKLFLIGTESKKFFLNKNKI